MDRLDELEAQSIFIFREAFARMKKLALLWSLGKDSNVMIWLARKAFFGHLPFPAMHVDTGKKFPEMYAFRDRYSGEWNLDLIVEPCPPLEGIDPTLPPAARSAARKTEGLKLALERRVGQTPLHGAAAEARLLGGLLLGRTAGQGCQQHLVVPLVLGLCHDGFSAGSAVVS